MRLTIGLSDVLARTLINNSAAWRPRRLSPSGIGHPGMSIDGINIAFSPVDLWLARTDNDQQQFSGKEGCRSVKGPDSR